MISATFWVWNNSLDNSSQNAMATSVSTPVIASSVQSEQSEERSPSESKNLPMPVQTAVLEAAASRTSRTVAEFQILEARRRNWSDGCLGISQPDELCTQVITPGWQVIVTDGRRNWVYRTDVLGERVKLAEIP
ncbi:hypothetical protein [Myxosarcina sp. GI1]|uniref:hypothetical protein n=1 Tax=Myxosarcina sp. GI1 TaxID=1541065 RepID=UPI0012E09761|nr:hypothetical protein [Myxosarcina sp. GI1]